MVHKDGQELFPCEQYQYQKNVNKVTSCFGVGFELNKGLNSEVITEAVKKLYDSRIKLRFNIFEENGKLIARELKEFPASSIEFWDEVHDDESTILNKLHDIDFRFGVQETTWKFVIINHKWIYVLCEHTFFDGTSAALILEDLLTILNDKELPKDSNPDETEWVKFTECSYSQLGLRYMDNWLPKWLTSPLKGFINPLSEFESQEPGWIINTPKKQVYQYKVHIISLDRSEFQILKDLGNQYGVKFTGLWTYLNLLAFAQIKNDNVTLLIPYNLRPFLSKDYEKAYGLIVSAQVNTLIPPRETQKINAEYLKFLGSTLNKENLIRAARQVGLYNYFNPVELLKSSMSKPRGAVLEISNLGLRTSHEGQKISAKQFMFTQANSLTGASITQSVASTKDRVNISIGCVPEFEEYFEKYIDNLETVLKNTLDGTLK